LLPVLHPKENEQSHYFYRQRRVIQIIYYKIVKSKDNFLNQNNFKLITNICRKICWNNSLTTCSDVNWLLSICDFGVESDVWTDCCGCFRSQMSSPSMKQGFVSKERVCCSSSTHSNWSLPEESWPLSRHCPEFSQAPRSGYDVPVNILMTFK